MNTRLQVEHPVTEETTGIDLVKEQLKIASGIPLGYSQEEIRQTGHSIEVRIYAEDPANNFMPSAGKIQYLRPPGGPGIREDSGIFEDSEVSLYYDSILSKLIVWGKARNEAVARMARALEEYRLFGIRTTIPFGLAVMKNKNFQTGHFDTGFVEKEFRNGSADVKNLSQIAAIAALLIDRQKAASEIRASANHHHKWESPWKTAGRVENMR
ncbi:MAG TPA: acetyl-CoA carboxylase biotin carboxylase subunit, partial [Bacteroidetes bacterium]|nr:acetyl-CoA carboxylase biotin carboxylase subunit [Bacteroidota bacterium]